jgi:quercetin dioxygenase-like cupin family protein
MGAACAREWHAGRKAAARRPISRRILEPTGGMMKLHLIGMLAVLIPIAGSQPAAAADPAPPKLVVRALADKEVTELPPGPLFWRIDRFPARAQAEAAAGRFSLVAETGGQVWLFTLGPAGGSSAGGTKVAEIGPIAPISASRYLLRINEASGPPGAVTSVHSHPGSEAFYVLAGETTSHTPERTTRIAAGESMAGNAAGTPMQVSSSGTRDLHSLVMFVVDAAKPFSSPAKLP